MSGLEVVFKDPRYNPSCPHGPTLLLSSTYNGITKNFYVCAANRSKQFCKFYLQEGTTLSKTSAKAFDEKTTIFCKGINHRKMYLIANKINQLTPSERVLCLTCTSFVLNNADIEHKDHKLIRGITDIQLANPTEMLPPAETDSIEAQYWFTSSTVKTIVGIFQSLNYRNVICIGAPRIHEYIRNNCDMMTSILLDFDKRFHNFFGPLEFCWYNMFNNYFFFEEAKEVFLDFLQMDSGDNIVIITDPPFGGRTEPIIITLRSINAMFQKLNKRKDKIPIYWIFPYFMEPHIRKFEPDFVMLDYKVQYENHNAFGIGKKARKQGSPVRIFTTADASLIQLPENEGYRFCEKCTRYVSSENLHCDICDKCPSKDGRTYVHCTNCNKCFKSTWSHCDKCNICKLPNHQCNIKKFKKACIYCRSFYHLKVDCPRKPKKDHHKKRKLINRMRNSKKNHTT